MRGETGDREPGQLSRPARRDVPRRRANREKSHHQLRLPDRAGNGLDMNRLHGEECGGEPGGGEREDQPARRKTAKTIAR